MPIFADRGEDMKRRMTWLWLLLALAVAAEGCSYRPERSGEPESGLSVSAVMAAESLPTSTPEPTPAPTPTPEPTPEPTPTPCPHEHWENGVCADCGLVCVHAQWEKGACAVCGLSCEHPEHNAETLLCSQCGERVLHTYMDNVCTLCGTSPEFETKNVPRELFRPIEEKGTIETLTYKTEVYTPTNAKEPVVTEKKLCVYLPYGYDPAEKYDLLILLHGARCDEEYWLLEEHDYSSVKLDVVYTYDLLDNLMAAGLSRKTIIATPTFYKNSAAPDYYNRPLDEPRFLRELREDILPLLIDKYSTYASDASPESISAVRQHFGFAGLSMGSIYAYTAVIPDSLDLFGWFGCFSGSDGYMDQLSARLNAEPDRDYPIYYFYNSIGTRDPYYYLHKSQYQDLVELTDGLTEGKNAAFTEVQGAGHEYYAWSTGLYNFLQIAFSLPE